MSRRTRLDIKAKILKVASEGTLKTNIMYEAKLSFTQLKRHLDRLSKEGFIVETKKGGRMVYLTSRKGLLWLAKWEELQEI